jgi:anti-sigma factor RsiW
MMMHKPDTKIDAFLDRLPLAPLPEGFTQRVMAAVKNEVSTKRKPGFRLEFLDLAIPVFSAFFATMVFGLAALILLNPFILLRVQLQLQPVLWRIPDDIISLAVVFSGAGIFCIMGILGAVGYLAQSANISYVKTGFVGARS